MAHGENAEKGGRPGKEYWKSRLHKHGEIPGRFTKKRTHKYERRTSRREITIELADFEIELAMRTIL